MKVTINRDRDKGIQRYKDTEIQRYRDTEIQRYRDTEIQRYFIGINLVKYNLAHDFISVQIHFKPGLK